MSDKIRTLALATEEAWRFHKARGSQGQIEACAARIRHVAIRHCWRIVDEVAERAHRAPWEIRHGG